MAAATLTLAGLAEQEGVSGVAQEVRCRKCSHFLGEIVVREKAVVRLKCRCKADNFLVVSNDRFTVVNGVAAIAQPTNK